MYHRAGATPQDLPAHIAVCFPLPLVYRSSSVLF